MLRPTVDVVRLGYCIISYTATDGIWWSLILCCSGYTLSRLPHVLTYHHHRSSSSWLFPSSIAAEKVAKLFQLIPQQIPERQTFLANSLRWAQQMKPPQTYISEIHRHVGIVLWKGKGKQFSADFIRELGSSCVQYYIIWLSITGNLMVKNGTIESIQAFSFSFRMMDVTFFFGLTVIFKDFSSSLQK